MESFIARFSPRFFAGLIGILLLLPIGLLHALPKREFRGAWVHTVWNTDYAKMSSAELQRYYIDLLDSFQRAGINAVIFQVRPAADAFYQSDLEPWSRFLTGKQGQAPNPLWDPLSFMVEECHRRAMEFHAWFNPYRAATVSIDKLLPEHPYHLKPELFFEYSKQLYFDPGHPEARKHTLQVVADVVRRYDIDAVHLDDYFYPYKVNGKEIPDQYCFKKYGSLDGFAPNEKDNWRRNNINLLVKALSDTIKKIKPWVRFGISPFCSEKVNYNQLYADIGLWTKDKTIDYVAPQLYWEIGHRHADYEKMLRWWTENSHGCQLYIGQNIESTVKVSTSRGVESQLQRKMQLTYNSPLVGGNIWWPGYLIAKNPDNFTDSIRTYYHHIALPPNYKYIDSIPPAPVVRIDTHSTPRGMEIRWQEPYSKSLEDKAVYYAVYCFKRDERVDLEDPTKLVKIQRETAYMLPVDQRRKMYKYVVTALDRMFNESGAVRVIIP